MTSELKLKVMKVVGIGAMIAVGVLCGLGVATIVAQCIDAETVEAISPKPVPSVERDTASKTVKSDTASTGTSLPKTKEEVDPDAWRLFEDKDIMTGNTSYRILSSLRTSERMMKFPYTDVEAALVFSCWPKQQVVTWGVFFTKDLILDGKKNIYRENRWELNVLVKWDDDEPVLVKMTNERNKSHLLVHSDNLQKFDDRMRKWPTEFLIRLHTYGENAPVHFRFWFSGFDSAYRKIYAKCGGQGNPIVDD